MNCLRNLNLVELNAQEVKDVEGGNLLKYFYKLARDYAVTEIGKYAIVKKALEGKPIKVFAGEDALEQVAAMDCYDFMMAGIVGFAGLKPTLTAVENGKAVGLANKETLVVAGDIVMQKAKENRAAIIPVDSEHSAIFQCLVGEQNNPIEKIILTASGGPFLGKKPNFLVNVKRDHALQHPNWSMGQKISVDSATLMNKGLELIEACHLFSIEEHFVTVVVHPQSIIHSMVQYVDGSTLAQMGNPDMCTPIAHALAWPERIQTHVPALDLFKNHQLDFQAPDTHRFPALSLARQAMKTGGTAPAILNAANEIAVAAFLNQQVGFMQIPAIVEHTLNTIPHQAATQLDVILEADQNARHVAQQYVVNIGI